MAAKNKSASDEILYVQTCLSDHRRDVAGMPAVQRGVYESMRVACYQLGGVLPDDLDTIYRLAEAHTPKEREAVRAVLEKKFTKEADNYRNAVCDVELMRIRTRKLQTTTAARTRWDSKQGDANASFPHMQTDMRTPMHTACESDANHKPITINQEPIKRTKAIPSSSQQEGKGDKAIAQSPGPTGPVIGDTIHSLNPIPIPKISPAQPLPTCVPIVGSEYISEIEQRNRQREAEREAVREKLFLRTQQQTITTTEQH